MARRDRDRLLGVGVSGIGWCAMEHLKAFRKNPHVRVLLLHGRDETRTREKLRKAGVDVPDAQFTTRYEDRFQKPTRFSADVVVDIDDVIEKKLASVEALHSQFFEGGANGGPQLIPGPDGFAARKKEVRDAFDGRFRATARRFGLQLAELYGAERGKGFQYAEAFEVCEYGRAPTKDELRKLFPFFPAG